MPLVTRPATKAAGPSANAHDTESGLVLLDTLGMDKDRFCKRPWSRVCLVDWSERREHLAGPLGNALHQRFLELGWVRAHLDSRAIRVTRTGERGFRSTFGMDVPQLLAATG